MYGGGKNSGFTISSCACDSARQDADKASISQFFPLSIPVEREREREWEMNFQGLVGKVCRYLVYY